MSNKDFQNRLVVAAKQLDLLISNEQQVMLLSYLQQLQRWNKTYNLTALRDPNQMLVQHVFDSLAILPYMDKEISRQAISKVTPCVVDVGSGGGLPGIVIAIMRPWQVVCIDAVEKKTSFIRQMLGVLGLSNLSVFHKRVEEMEGLQANIIVSRAFATLSDFIQLAKHHLGETGCFFAMKGQIPTEEITTLEQNNPFYVDFVTEIQVPELKAERCLIGISPRK